jgi:hypothetical protein
MPFFYRVLWDHLYHLMHLEHITTIMHELACHGEEGLGNRRKLNCRFPCFLTSEPRCLCCCAGFRGLLIIRAIFQNSRECKDENIYRVLYDRHDLHAGLLRLCLWGLRLDCLDPCEGCKRFAWQIRNQWHR